MNGLRGVGVRAPRWAPWSLHGKPLEKLSCAPSVDSSLAPLPSRSLPGPYRSRCQPRQSCCEPEKPQDRTSYSPSTRRRSPDGIVVRTTQVGVAGSRIEVFVDKAKRPAFGHLFATTECKFGDSGSKCEVIVPASSPAYAAILTQFKRGRVARVTVDDAGVMKMDQTASLKGFTKSLRLRRRGATSPGEQKLIRGLWCVAISLILMMQASTASAASIVTEWLDQALPYAQEVAWEPTVGARFFAVLHTAMYDAWTAYDPIAVGVVSGTILKGLRRRKQRSEQARSHQSCRLHRFAGACATASACAHRADAGAWL